MIREQVTFLKRKLISQAVSFIEINAYQSALMSGYTPIEEAFLCQYLSIKLAKKSQI